MQFKNNYRIISGEELRKLYYSYHSLDLRAAIERIMERNGTPITNEEEQQRQLQIMRFI